MKEYKKLILFMFIVCIIYLGSFLGCDTVNTFQDLAYFKLGLCFVATILIYMISFEEAFKEIFDSIKNTKIE